jgi:hypothetical protein
VHVLVVVVVVKVVVVRGGSHIKKQSFPFSDKVRMSVHPVPPQRNRLSSEPIDKIRMECPVDLTVQAKDVPCLYQNSRFWS